MYKYTNTTLSRPLDLKAVIRLHIGQYLLHQELVGGTGVVGATEATGARHVACYCRTWVNEPL